MKEAVVEQQIKISKLERQGPSHLSNLPKAATPTGTPDTRKINPGDGNETDVSTRVSKTEEQEREKERTERKEAKREEKEEVKREEREEVKREDKEEAERGAKGDDEGRVEEREEKRAPASKIPSAWGSISWRDPRSRKEEPSGMPTPQNPSGWESSRGSSLSGVVNAFADPDSDRSPSPEPPQVKPKIEDPPRGFTPSHPPKTQPAVFGSPNKPAWGAKPGPAPIVQKTPTGPARSAKPTGPTFYSGVTIWGGGAGSA